MGNVAHLLDQLQFNRHPVYKVDLSMTECDNLLKQNLLPGVRIDKPSFKITRFSIAVNAYTRIKLMRHVSIHRV